MKADHHGTGSRCQRGQVGRGIAAYGHESSPLPGGVQSSAAACGFH